MKSNTKRISATLALVFFANQVVMAQNSNLPTRNLSTISEEDILGVDQETAQLIMAEMQMTLSQVQKLKIELAKKMNSQERDPVLKFVNGVQIALIVMNSAAVTTHLRSQERTNAALITSAATALCDLLARHYKKNGTLSQTDIKDLINETSTTIIKNTKNGSALQQTVADLANLSNTIDQSSSKLSAAIHNMGGASDAVAVGTIAYVVLHFVAPKLAKEGDEAIKTFLPKLQDISNKALHSSKSAMVGSNMTTSVTDILGMAAGFSSDDAKGLVSTIQTNLNETEMNLKSQIAHSPLAK